MYGYRCEYCEGAVKARTVERESFKHKNGFIILEDVVIGVCDRCGNRYYSAAFFMQSMKSAQGSGCPRELKPFQ